ncbi:MAG TPA: hypothetical protein VIF57_18695, partial [Polyangia bacterium]
MSQSRVGVSASLFVFGALVVFGGCGRPAVDDASSAESRAGALTARGTDPGDAVVVKRPPPPPPPPPPPSGSLTNPNIGNVTTTTVSWQPTFTCATTAAIYSVQPSVPITDGAPCASDLDCGTGAFCSPGAGGASACHTSGLLQRGDIYYVAGTTLDLTMIVSACGSISDVLQGSASLGGTGGFDDTGKQYFVLSTTNTTFNGQDATKIVVRINLL